MRPVVLPEDVAIIAKMPWRKRTGQTLASVSTSPLAIRCPATLTGSARLLCKLIDPELERSGEASMHTRREFACLGAGAFAAAAFLPAGCTQKNAVTFANPSPVWWNAVPLIAARHGFYDAENVQVLGFDVPTGVRSKQAIVDGNAAMGVASPNAISTSTDAALGALRILASITQSNSTVAIIIRAGHDLLNSRIGYVQGATSEFYLLAYLIQTGQLDAYRLGGNGRRRLDLVNLAPPNLVTAFANRDIDVAVAWEPFASQIEMSAQGADPVRVIRDESLYTQHIFALSDRQIGPDPRQRVLKALRRAAEHISSNRAAVGAELEQFFQFPEGFLTRRPVWDKVNFRFSQNRDEVLAALNRDWNLAKGCGVAQTSGGRVFDDLVSEMV
jgi:ABC-type nitrate/sulfonate/bicarbonate transport system substrate-binding protein